MAIWGPGRLVARRRGWGQRRGRREGPGTSGKGSVDAKEGAVVKGDVGRVVWVMEGRRTPLKLHLLSRPPEATRQDARAAQR